MINNKIKIIIIFLIASVFLTACNNDKKNVVRMGVNSDEMEVWDYIKKELDKEGIDLEIVTFNDYIRPNLALADGDIDLNSFQHYSFFNKFKEEHNLDLTAIGETVIAPLGIYSNKYRDIDEISKGDTLAIPNDETNGSRALYLLESAGLISLKDKEFVTVKDIIYNKLNLNIIEMDASMISRSLEDVELAVINSGFAVDAGLIPIKDSIYLEDINEKSKDFINIIAVRTEDKDNDVYKKIVKLYQSKEVEDIINEIYKGSQKIAW